MSSEEADAGAERAPEQDVLIHLKLSNSQMGTSRERADLEDLAAELQRAVSAAGAGEFDGDEVGGGECVLFFSGPDADRLLAVLHPLLHRHPAGRRARVQVQYGDGPPVEKKR